MRAADARAAKLLLCRIELKAIDKFKYILIEQ